MRSPDGETALYRRERKSDSIMNSVISTAVLLNCCLLPIRNPDLIRICYLLIQTFQISTRMSRRTSSKIDIFTMIMAIVLSEMVSLSHILSMNHF